MARVSYFGFYPLGDDVVLGNIKIMQKHWNEFNRPVIVIGKKNVVSPCWGDVYYVTDNADTIFFVAIEYGLGHYHIFVFHEKSQQKLRKRIRAR